MEGGTEGESQQKEDNKKKTTNKKKPNAFRKLRVPSLNFNAATISQLCPWESGKATEPCITSHLTNEELLKFTENPLELPNIPCH